MALEKISLKDFTPIGQDLVLPSTEVFGNALNKIDEYDTKAREIVSNQIDAAAGELKKNIHNDKTSEELFDNELAKIKEPIERMVSFGLYDKALPIATTQAGKLLNNVIINGMISSEKQHNVWEEDLRTKKNQGAISDVRYRRYLQKADDEYKTDFVHSGDKIIGVKDWNPGFNTYYNVNFDGIVAQIDSIVKANINSTDNTRQGKTIINEDGTSTGYQRGSQNSLEEKDKERLYTAYDHYFNVHNQELVPQLNEYIEDLIFEYNELEQQLRDLDPSSPQYQQLKERKEHIYNTYRKNDGWCNGYDYYRDRIAELTGDLSYKHFSSANVNMSSESDKKSKQTTPNSYVTGQGGGYVAPGNNWSNGGQTGVVEHDAGSDTDMSGDTNTIKNTAGKK